jgi:hypothetical protein
MKNFLKMHTLLLCLAITLFVQETKAQVDTSTTQKLLQYIFQNIDKGQISTGFLEEYGCPILPMTTFNGTLTDSNRIDMHLWRTLYFQLQTGYTGSSTNPLPAITSANATIKQQIVDTLPIPIPLLIAQYNTVSNNAFTNNLLSYNSSTRQIADVSGRSQNPYIINNLFAACPNNQETYTGSETFVIPSSLVWNTTNKTISQMQIDFADGNGLQTITIGSPKTVTYTDTGYKRWIIKTTLSDNSVLQCYSEYYVHRTASSYTTLNYQSSQTVLPSWGIINPVAGVHSGAIVTVNYSKLNPTTALRKPLIVVEGYDVSRRASKLQDNYSFRDFIAGINAPFDAGYDFNNQLDNIAGYDLVFIDFNDGADDIVRNAAVVQEVINRVNANKVNDNRFGNIRQQNVVMGLSMGGLCARFALANMTKNFPNTPTETRLLITHDSPHKGANVPLGLQYMIRMLGGVQLFGYNVYDIYPDYNDAINLMNAPATTQLLLYSATSANTFSNNTFLDATYRPMITFAPTDPQPSYRFVATALGNECANPLFNPSKTFINIGAGVSAGIYAKFPFFKIPIVTYKLAAEVEAYALPNTGSTDKIARVYTINNLKLFGLINVFKQLYDNTAYAPSNHLAVDGVPGSNYPLINLDALNQITSLPNFSANLSFQIPIIKPLTFYFDAYAYNQGVAINFTFVPVGSALDVNPYTTPVFAEKYVNGTNQSYPSTSETFIAQETVQNNAALTNNVHIRFTARNSHWLFNEMENLPNTLNCSNECSNAYYISGNNPICNTETYFIPGLPRGATVTWSFNPSNLVTTSTNGNNITLQRVVSANGELTLTATISNACGGNNVINKTISIGTPTTNISVLPFTTGQQYCTNSFGNTLIISPANAAESYQWGYSSSQNNIQPTIINQNGSSEQNFNFYLGGNYQIFANPQNACGIGPIATLDIFVNDNCGGGGFGFFAVSPNPTTGDVQVETTSTDKTTTIKEIQVTDKFGNLKKKIKLNTGIKKHKINISELPADVYIIRIYDGKTWTSKKVIKN